MVEKAGPRVVDGEASNAEGYASDIGVPTNGEGRKDREGVGVRFEKKTSKPCAGLASGSGFVKLDEVANGGEGTKRDEPCEEKKLVAFDGEKNAGENGLQKKNGTRGFEIAQKLLLLQIGDSKKKGGAKSGNGGVSMHGKSFGFLSRRIKDEKPRK